MTELVPDPDFNDALKWDTSGIVSGSGLVAGGKFTGTGWGGTVVPIAQEDAVVGDFYYFEIVVDSFQFNISGLPVAQIGFGGKALWIGQAGPGTFTGVIQATSNIGASFSSLLLFGVGDSDIVISRISIMAVSIREGILQSLTAQVETITTANGYDLNLVTVDRARRVFTEDELPACGIFDNDEENSLMHGAQKNLLSVAVEAHSDAGLMNRSTHANTLISALKKGVMSFDATFGGLADRIHISLVSTNYPQDDDETVISVSLVFLVDYEEAIGDPYNNP